MSIKIDLKSISKEGANIFGNIYFESDTVIFPEKGWNDFIIIVLNWWSSSLLNLIERKSIIEEFDFMDGPLSIEFRYLDDNIYKVRFLSKNKEVKSENIDLNQFYSNFVKLLNSLIRYTKEQGWKGEELNKLNINYNNLLISPARPRMSE